MRSATSLLLWLMAPAVSALDAPGYPHLMEFDQALEKYEAGEMEVARAAFRHLAELGWPAARFNLGVMLAKGQGGERDMAEALAWVHWAAEDGDESATGALPIFEKAAGEAGRAAAAEVLVELQAAHGLDALVRAPSGVLVDEWAIERPPPSYPRGARINPEEGVVTLHFLARPGGRFGAVQGFALQGSAFVRPAEDAVRTWRISGCSPGPERLMIQTIEFQLADAEYREDTRLEVGRWLAQAKAGDAGQAYRVAILTEHHPDLVAIEESERWQLMHRAAVAGIPAARFEIFLRLAQSESRREHAERWALLAAMQGFAPAGVIVYRRSIVAAEDGFSLVVRAAEAGYLPAVVIAARRLATDPEESRRDDRKALELTGAVSSRVLKVDPLLAETHAAALAATGDFDAAVRWQKRAMTAARGLGWDTRNFDPALAAYEDKTPWRGPLPPPGSLGPDMPTCP